MASGLELDFEIYASRKFQTLHCFYRFVGRSENVDKSLVGSHFKLFPAVFVFVYSTEDCYNLFLSRERNRPRNPSTCSLCCFNDLRCRSIASLIIYITGGLTNSEHASGCFTSRQQKTEKTQSFSGAEFFHSVNRQSHLRRKPAGILLATKQLFKIGRPV